MSISGGTPSGSSSTIVAAAASGYHLLKIGSYSRTKGVPTRECIVSRPFTVGGHRWHINYYPKGENSYCADYISVFLVLDENDPEAVKAQFRLYFVDDVKNQPPWTSRPVRDFADDHYSWGYAKFIRRESLEKSKHLKDDSFTIRCDIVVIKEYRAEDRNLVSASPPFVSVPPPELHQHLDDLLKTEKGADVVFEVGGETVAAHRCVLAVRSPVFSAELFGSMREGNSDAGVIRIQDMTAQVFKALLHFVYTELLPETKKEDEDVMCQHLLVAADRYRIERLKLICEAKLCEYIAVGTVATILTLADQHHCQGLKNACFHFLRSPANLRAAMATDDFQHMSKTCPSVMLELIALSTVP